jgi:hypothetical protein
LAPNLPFFSIVCPSIANAAICNGRIGVYTTTPRGKSRFHRTHAPDRQELTELVHTISHRIAGFLERDEENSYLNLKEGDEDPMQQV